MPVPDSRSKIQAANVAEESEALRRWKSPIFNSAPDRECEPPGSRTVPKVQNTETASAPIVVWVSLLVAASDIGYIALFYGGTHRTVPGWSILILLSAVITAALSGTIGLFTGRGLMWKLVSLAGLAAGLGALIFIYLVMDALAHFR
ncbi:MAG TPA: hypothetical protein VFF16_14635 [Telluria sp.]|nr:hypothetical protein [Telluria sp.]